MSRIIVKQLPKNITEEKLRNLFGSKGTITDLQLKYTSDGKFRQFCFIGYRSEEEAQEAVKFFHNTCIQTNRIKVETCAALGGEDKPPSWSKYAKDRFDRKSTGSVAKDSEPNEDDKKGGKLSRFDEIISKHKDDPEFQEFIKAHDKNRTLWANDVAVGAQYQSGDQADNSNDDECQDIENNTDDDRKAAETEISDLEYMKSLMTKKEEQEEQEQITKKSSKGKNASLDLFTIKIHNVPYKSKRQDIIKFFKPLKPFSVRLPTKVHGFCYVGFKTQKEMAKAMLKNKSFIRGKQVFFSDFTAKNKITKAKSNKITSGQSNANDVTVNPKWAKQKEGVVNGEDISESGSIFFRNLAYTVTENDLQQLFEEFGPVAEMHLPVDTLTRQIKGFGTVTYMMPEHAVKAFNQLDGRDFHGRLLHLIPAKSKQNENDIADEADTALTFKQKKALKLKKSAQQADSWNSLFLGPNVVAEILAKKFETSKERILGTDDGGSDAAVRIALGETQVVIEMKKFLEENGVCLDVFDAANAKRSKTIILAKNLPFDTTVAELSPIFSKFGPIGRLVLPPSGVSALIEYCDPSEARQAFKKLAYSKFKNVPLFLEWAPEHVFTTPSKDKPNKGQLSQLKTESNNDAITEVSSEVVSNTERPSTDSETVVTEIEEDNEPPEPNTTLFLRNLNFKTVADTVRNHFKHLGQIHSVEIAKRRSAEDPRNLTSLGYGFIQFKKNESAEKALKSMQFTTIDGNRVELKRSDRTLKTAQTQSHRKKVDQVKQTGSKILVRNIPFQAKPKEVRDIFKAFGELRSVRLPMKMSPGEDTHRGFGFVDFMTKSDAKKAFDALSQSTHLYGRRIVLEWASTSDEDVDELRKRTAQQYEANDKGSAKRSRRAIFEAGDNHSIASSAKDNENILEDAEI